MYSGCEVRTLWLMSVLYIFLPPADNQSSVSRWTVCCMFFFLCQPHVTGINQIILTPERCQSHVCFLHKSRSWSSRIPAQTNESVELLGKEHSSDQCHMMQEVCQHFSSSSLAIGRGMYTLPASKGWIKWKQVMNQEISYSFFMWLVVN